MNINRSQLWQVWTNTVVDSILFTSLDQILIISSNTCWRHELQDFSQFPELVVLSFYAVVWWWIAKRLAEANVGGLKHLGSVSFMIFAIDMSRRKSAKPPDDVGWNQMSWSAELDFMACLSEGYAWLNQLDFKCCWNVWLTPTSCGKHWGHQHLNVSFD